MVLLDQEDYCLQGGVLAAHLHHCFLCQGDKRLDTGVQSLLDDALPFKGFVNNTAEACVLLRAPLALLLAPEILAPGPLLAPLGLGACYKCIHDTLLGHQLRVSLACLRGSGAVPSMLAPGAGRMALDARGDALASL